MNIKIQQDDRTTLLSQCKELLSSLGKTMIELSLIMCAVLVFCTLGSGIARLMMSFF